jgi:hypothetical protein
MEMHQVRYQNREAFYSGVRYTHNNYTCEWRGRNVSVSYSKKNGCGYISFGATDAEKEEINAKAEAELKEAEERQIARRKSDPEKRAKMIAFYKMKIDALGKEWEEEKQAPDYDKSDAEYYLERIANFQSKLEKYES